MNKNIIIIILILILGIIIGLIFATTMMPQNNTKTIQLSNSCSVNVTESDTQLTTYADTIKLYNDTKNNIFILSYNSQEAYGGLGNALGGAVTYASMRDNLTIGENIGELNGFSLYKCNGYYSAKLVNNVTHDNIVIVCKDLDLLKKIVSSVKLSGNTNGANNITNGNNANSNSNNSKQPYSYADDGSPIWTKAEFEKYVMDKGGYSSLDEYYAVQRGDQQAIDNYHAHNYVPDSTPTPTPTPGNGT